MLASFDVRLEPLNPGLTVTQDTGGKARGLLYQLLAEVDEPLATEVHDAVGAKPFTCSARIASGSGAW